MKEAWLFPLCQYYQEKNKAKTHIVHMFYFFLQQLSREVSSLNAHDWLS